jgi:type I restriction enzyme M protein
MRAQEARLTGAAGAWWQAHEPRLLRLPETGGLMAIRADFLVGFVAALAPVGLLDRFKVEGVIASWWNEIHYDLKTLAAQGFRELVSGWVETARAALAEGNGGLDLASARLVARLVPGFQDEIDAAEAKKAELESRLDAAKPADDEEDDGEEPEDVLSPADRKALGKELAAARKELNALKASLDQRLHDASTNFSAEECAGLALGIFREVLDAQLDRYVTAHRQQVIAAVENWGDEYQISLNKIDATRNITEEELASSMRLLGYAG